MGPIDTPARTHDRGGAFGRTRWSVVYAAGDEGKESSRAALGALCEQYWLPLFAYARRHGAREAEAQDQVQGFFATLLDGAGVAGADPERGSFRSYLLGAFRHFLSHERDRDNAVKRGAGVPELPLDYGTTTTRIGFELRDDETPERAFDRAWGHALLDDARARLRAEHEERGQGERFDRFQPFLGGAGDEERYAEVADQLDMTEVAVKVAIHRLRRRLGELIRDAARETLGDGGDEGEELRELFSAL